MKDLFDDAPVAGLRLSPEIVAPAQEAALIGRINGVGLAPFRFQQWTGKRLTRSFGWNYDFESAAFAAAEPMPDWLLPVRERAARFAGLPAAAFVQALLIRYDPGAGIGWHRDRPLFEHIVGISLGNEATLRLRRRRDEGGFDRASVELAPRSAYLLAGPARHGWEHSIAPMAVPRWSITFRSLSAQGVAMANRTAQQP